MDAGTGIAFVGLGLTVGMLVFKAGADWRDNKETKARVGKLELNMETLTDKINDQLGKILEAQSKALTQLALVNQVVSVLPCKEDALAMARALEKVTRLETQVEQIQDENKRRNFIGVQIGGHKE